MVEKPLAIEIAYERLGQAVLRILSVTMRTPGEDEEARQAKRGLWANPKYAVATPDTARNFENDWAIVEGTVYGTALNNNMLYLNFGPDWHTDFTIAINSAVRRDMEVAHIDPLSLSNKRVRVRGWLRDYNGPYMELDNVVWLETIP